MTLRSLVIATFLGLGISAYTYFNDHVAHQTSLIGNFLPISVFGIVVVLLLGVNPLLRKLGPRWAFTGKEMAVIMAITLMACAYPGHNFGRYFVPMTTAPARLLPTKVDWQANELMSYLPGGSARLAQGQVRDWPALVTTVRDSRDGDQLPAKLYTLATAEGKAAWDNAFEASHLTSQQLLRLVTTINNVLRQPAFSSVDTAADQSAHFIELSNRVALEKSLPDLIIPVPRGSGALVANGRAIPEVTDVLAQGLNTGQVLPVGRVPWDIWWPTIRLWGVVVLGLGLVTFCMGLIVHHQWSVNELLQYPLAQFVETLGKQNTASGLPQIAHQPMFWVGLGLLVLLHVINGLHAWFPAVPQIPMQLDFSGMGTYFPLLGSLPTRASVFTPVMYLSIVAFAFMLNRSVSFTLGIAPLFFLLFSALFVSNGIYLPYDKATPNNMNMLRLGAYIGVAITIFYTGRAYYSRTIIQALGLKRYENIPPAAVWAARCMAPLLVLSIAMLTTSGMSPLVAVVMVAVCLIVWLAIARIVAETGMILISGPFLPLGVLPALLGYDTLGPTQMLLLGIGGFILIGDPRECLMPFVVNGLRMADRANVRIARLAPWMAGAVVVSFSVVVVVVIALQYEHGLNHSDVYGVEVSPSRPFSEAGKVVSDLAAQDTLSQSVSMNDWQRLTSIHMEPWAIGWTAAGLVLVLGAMFARLRIPWWPLHPVLFLVLGTWAIDQLGFSFVLGWVLKSAVIYAAGLRGYQMMMPLMCGVIAGELLGGLIWMVVGALYYSCTGLVPPIYSIYP